MHSISKVVCILEIIMPTKKSIIHDFQHTSAKTKDQFNDLILTTQLTRKDEVRLLTESIAVRS